MGINITYWSSWGSYPNLIDFEAEVLAMNDNAIYKAKIITINEQCEKLSLFFNHEGIKTRNDKHTTFGRLSLMPIVEIVDENTVHLTINTAVKNENNSKFKQLHFDNWDLINSINNIQSIIASLPADKDQLTTKANDNRLKFIWQLLIDDKLIDDKTQLKDWLYWFGKNTIEEPRKIKWIGADLWH